MNKCYWCLQSFVVKKLPRSSVTNSQSLLKRSIYIFSNFVFPYRAPQMSFVPQTLQAFITFVHNHVHKVSDFFRNNLLHFLTSCCRGCTKLGYRKTTWHNSFAWPSETREDPKDSFIKYCTTCCPLKVLVILLHAWLHSCTLQGVCEVDVNCDPLPARLQNMINAHTLLFVSKKDH